VQEYQLATVQVNVTDGKLSVDAIGGTKLKQLLEIVNVSPDSHPSVTARLRVTSTAYIATLL